MLEGDCHVYGVVPLHVVVGGSCEDSVPGGEIFDLGDEFLVVFEVEEWLGGFSDIPDFGGFATYGHEIDPRGVHGDILNGVVMMEGRQDLFRLVI